MTRTATLRPVSTGIALPREPLDYFRSIARHPFPFILESQSTGRWTFLGSNPYRVLLVKESRVTDWRAGRAKARTADPFDAIRDALAEHRVEPDPAVPFPGGAVGYLGYDLAQHLEKLPRRAVDDRGFPDAFLAFYDRVVAADRETGRASVIELSTREEKRAMTPADYAETFAGPAPMEPWRPVTSNFTRDAYLAAVRRAKDYIAAGDIYQVNLSQRFATTTPLAPIDVYRRLREVSPAPFGALLQIGNRAVVSSSPELFLQKDGRRVVTRPIKGTRRRGGTPEDDERLRAELYASSKDAAELAMIVDLERNDLGRVCDYGTVRVPDLKALESHPTVHHLVATIEGRLRREADAVDLLRAAFPTGSITGAPKIRAMEIIDELEPTRRAAYTGAIGTLGFDGNLNLSVAIRILELHGANAWFQVGGGLVADSIPDDEFAETLVKATGMVRALGVDLPR
jgi:para-aminobenzoate synthetase component 1